MSDPIHIISLGAGVQSSTMALMAASGEIIPTPIAAIFADTQDEPEEVYTWLDWLEKQLPFPVHRVTRGGLSEHVFTQIEKGERVSKPPLFVLNADKTIGVLTRDCTGDFKIALIKQTVRKLLKEYDSKLAVQWKGISLDEVHRMKPSDVKYALHRWPLIEKRMRRHDCELWLSKRGWKAPRSACVQCPYHSDNYWRYLRDNHPKDWQKAVDFDKRTRTGIHGVRGQCFVHKQCVPLDEVNLDTDEDQGQQVMFGNECSGLCGV